MADVFQADDAFEYRMAWDDPHRELEPLERETAVVDAALEALVEAGVLPHTNYDTEKMLAHRRAVRENFEIPWTAISPRMQRFLFALNAIAQPKTVVAVGIFCGNTFISNAGAAAGPGRCYDAERLIGIEIDENHADFADAIGELANMVAGAAKTDMEGLNLSISLPSVVIGENHMVSQSKTSPRIVIPCQCELGPIYVEIGMEMKKTADATDMAAAGANQ